MKKVLVVHTWGLGDLIMSTPMLKSLAKSGYIVDLILTQKTNKTVVENFDFVNRVFLIKSNFEYLRFFKKYNYLVTTTGISKNKAFILNLIINAKKLFYGGVQKDIHRIETNLNIVKDILKVKETKTSISIKKNEIVLKKYLKNDKKNIGFAIGSGVRQKFKRWDIEKFIALMKKFDANKLVFIGKDELDLEDKLKGIDDITVVKESLENVISIISKLDYLIGNDNGLMHIGYATGIETFTIFGMTNPLEIGGYDREKNHSIMLSLECMPCFNSANDKIGCRSLNCFKDLSVEFVFKSILKRVEL